MTYTVKKHWLAELVRQVNRAQSYQDLTDITLQFALQELGLSHSWIYLRLKPLDDTLSLLAVSGPRADHIRQHIPILPISGDPLMEALCRGEGPFLIDDVQTLPGVNREVVELLGNRALCNAPLADVNDSYGTLGAGTFGEEGPRTFEPAHVDRYMQVVSVLSAGVARIRLREQHAANEELSRQLAKRQRLESLGLLAGGVAHDLNNLLTVIQVSLDFVADAGLSSQQASDIELATSAVQSAADLTKQLLALGRAKPLALGMADLTAVVGKTHELLSRLLPATIQLQHTPSPRPLQIRSDEGAIEQIILNLALNARDAMPDGGTLTFQTEEAVISEDDRDRPWAKPGRYARFTVTDSGVGMSPDVLEQVFTPFFTTRSEEGGTGLGLSVVYGIVEQHSGMLRCRSELGCGTTFEVYLPLADRQASALDARTTGPVSGGTERILVVEDTSSVRQVMERVLISAGYTVDTAVDGADALPLLDAGGYDLFIIDAVMPRMNGRATSEAVRAREPGARILITSGYASEALPAAFMRDLKLPTIPKPFSPDTLLRTVRSLLDAPPQR